MARQRSAWRPVRVVLAVCLAISGIALVGGVSGAPAPADPGVVIDIDVDEAGDAAWSIEYHFVLDDPEAEAAFADLAEAVRAGEASLPLDEAAIAAFLADAEAATDRDMAIEDATWYHTVDGDHGTLSLSFTWRNFAGTVGDRLEVGSAFYGTDGTWLSTLDDGMRLSITGPEDAAPEAVPENATVDDGTVTWAGPQTFTAGDIDLRYPIAEQADTTVSFLGLAVAAIALIAGGVGIGVRRGWWQRSADTDTEASATPSAPIDESLLSDPERVERLLADNGGRMKQAAIVEATGWSSAKVSQLLSEMAEAGRIEKLRIGQENLISLPNEDDDAS